MASGAVSVTCRAGQDQRIGRWAMADETNVSRVGGTRGKQNALREATLKFSIDAVLSRRFGE